MQTVRTLIWVIFAVLLTAFVFTNFTIVEVNLYGFGVVDWPLALVIVVAFLLGFLPMLLLYRTAKWTAHRKIKQQDDTIAMLRPAAPAPPAPVIETPVTPLSTDPAL